MELRAGLRRLVMVGTALTLMLGVAAAQQQLTLRDRVQVILGPLNVRAAPALSAEATGRQETGAQGTVTNASPHNADGIWWWLVDFDEGADGWVAEGRGGDQYLAGSAGHGSAQEGTESTHREEASTAAVDTQRTPESGASQLPTLQGVWEGMVVRASGPTSRTYPAELRLLSGASPGEQIGTVLYPPGGECGEYPLVFESTRNGTMEVVRQGTANCSGTVQLTMTLSSETLELLGSDGGSYTLEEPHIMLTYEIETSTYHGTLFRQDSEGLRKSQDRRRYELLTQFTGEPNPQVFEGVRISCGHQWYGDVVASTTWTGDCIDGFIAGTGRLEVLQPDGMFLWGIDVTESNGLKLVDGIITADIDESDFISRCVRNSGGYIYVQVSSSIALFDPRVATTLLAIGASIYENEPCFTPEVVSGSASVRIQLLVPGRFLGPVVGGLLLNGRPQADSPNQHAESVAREHEARRRADRAAAQAAEQEAARRAAAQAERDAVAERRQAFARQHGVTRMLDQGCDWTFNPFDLEGATVGMMGMPLEMASATSARFRAHVFVTSPGAFVGTVVHHVSWCDAAIIVLDVPRGTFTGSQLGLLAARVEEVADGVLRLTYLGSHACQERNCEEFRVR